MNVFADEKLRQKMTRLKGVRLLRQDPVETLFTFICSSNNNIQRISSMVDKLCMTYGQHIAQVDIRSLPVVDKSSFYEERSTNKLQNGIILLMFII